MPDYHQLLDDIVNGSVADSSINSAAANTLDMPQLISWQPGSVQAQWQVQPAYMNSRGVLFGGYYAVLADVVLAFASMTVMRQDEHYSTQDLNVSFFKPVSEGRLYLTAEVVTRTRSRIYTECRFLDAQDKVLAVASAAQHVRPLEQIAQG